MNIMDGLKTVLLVMLFYSFAITLISYAMPADARNYVTSFSEISSSLTLESVNSEVQDSLQAQSSIPVIDVGTLIFYSGNILIDLILNFVFAIPEMIGLLVNGIMMIFNIDSYFFAIVEIFFSVIVIIIYFIGLMEGLTALRSGRAIT